MTREEADLRLVAHRLRWAQNAIETSGRKLDDQDGEYLEEIASLVDMIQARINGAVFADAWLMDARVEAVLNAVGAKHRRGAVTILPPRPANDAQEPKGAA